MTTEAPASSTRGWLDQWFLGNLGIGAATEEESGQQPDTSDTYNQQYARYNTRNNRSFSYFCLSPMDDWFPGREKVEQDQNEFDRLECRRQFLKAKPGRMDPMPKECEGLLYSISFLTFKGEWEPPCECHDTESNTNMCDKYYGGCE